MILPEMRTIIPVGYEIFRSRFWAGLNPGRFANLSGQEVNQLVKQGYSALIDGPKQ